MNTLFPNPMLRSKIRYFRYLSNRGFKVSKTSNLLESIGGWFIEFESSDGYILIFSHRAEISVRFYPIKEDRNTITDLGFMLYFLSNGKLFIRDGEEYTVRNEKQQLKKISNLLEEYIDRIMPYFGEGYVKNKDNIAVATEIYEKFQLAKYGLQKVKTRVKGL